MPKVFHRQDLRLKKRKLRMSEFEWHMSPRLGQLVDSKHLEFYIVSFIQKRKK